MTLSIATPTLTAGILTCSYRGDFEPCQVLCASVDRFVPADMEHLLIVPRADVALFTGLAGGRRRVAAAEDFQPWWLIGIPMPGPKWRKRLFLPRREVLFSLKSPPIRGWIAQQLRKLAVARDAPWDVIVHVDSDNVFFRPLTHGHLIHGDRVRLFHNPGHADMMPHNRWHRSAARLLGLPMQSYFGADYIDPFIVWRRDVARRLTNHISTVAGTDWVTALARTPHFAEYILYGVFVDHILKEAAGHFHADRSLCFARWADAFTGEDDERSFVEQMQPHHILCNLQSTIGMTMERRKTMYAQLQARAAQQTAEQAGKAGLPS